MPTTLPERRLPQAEDFDDFLGFVGALFRVYAAIGALLAVAGVTEARLGGLPSDASLQAMLCLDSRASDLGGASRVECGAYTRRTMPPDPMPIVADGFEVHPIVAASP